MVKKWTFTHCGNVIVVENTWFSGERLYVNGELQDETHGAIGANLAGHLNTGERIKAVLGNGWTGIRCKIFIDDKLVFHG